MGSLLLDATLSALLFVGNAENTTLIRRDMGDSLLVIQTVCEPICSSRACVFSKEGTLLRTLQPPFEKAIFPEAYLGPDSTVLWRDNTNLLLDDEEKKVVRL